MSKHAQLRQDRLALSKAFPKLFRVPGEPGVKWPLKIGVDREVIASKKVRDERDKRLSPKRIRAAIKDYCSGQKYAMGILVSCGRYDLNGQLVGPIKKGHILFAKAYLRRIGVLEPDEQEIRGLAATTIIVDELVSAPTWFDVIEAASMTEAA